MTCQCHTVVDLISVQGLGALSTIDFDVLNQILAYGIWLYILYMFFYLGVVLSHVVVFSTAIKGS